MKYKLKYSPDARDKLRDIKSHITELYGRDVATNIVTKITREIKGLQDNPKKGASVEALLGIPTPSFTFSHMSSDLLPFLHKNTTEQISPSCGISIIT